ncbi:MAG: chemotaxis protein CheD [Parcubacteria group bacterium Gr01-1014_18]|nr:MAG: chemotaxis protein CheD [Parcubacteria group bacterium Greene0416_36]TSC80996.1 MAG: chemotaxis protein CheD [Parcubacteria group bacterium Gr01-1014_18]TSC98883.1 MAG: chemotaxis protein CheD [Parcubacteria group bacterium Greene1014_20]TSD06531.1 MAG: chemotaxis protein CheD [Parcubacteria group bacterium Greene0714_2]
MGEWAVGAKEGILESGAVGSCVVIVLYDPSSSSGGMAHAMLPSRTNLLFSKEGGIDFRGKFADEAVSALVQAMEKLRIKKENLRATLAGGAQMFALFGRGEEHIGFQNVSAARRRLSELGIPIESSDTGGHVGRGVRLDLSTGKVSIRKAVEE